MTTARPRAAWMGTAPAGREGSVQEGRTALLAPRKLRHPKRRALRGVQERNLTVRVFFRGKIRSSFGQVFRPQGRWLFENQLTPPGLGSREPAECPMDECLFASMFAALPVGGKTAPRRKRRVVWKWSGNGLVFPARAPERGSMTRRSTTILQAENQNRSKTSPVSGGRFFDL